MALARTWHSVVDIPLDDVSTTDAINRSVWLALKRCLVGDFSAGGTVGPNGPPPRPWSVEYSSNAVVADAGDHWASTGDIVGNSVASGARSWIALQSPSGTRRLFVDLGLPQLSSARVFATKEAVSNGGALSVSEAPNASTLLRTNSVTWENGSGGVMPNTMNGLHRAALTMCSEGEHWMFIVYKPASFPANVVAMAMGIWPIRSRAEVGDFAHPWALFLPYSSNGSLHDILSMWGSLSVTTPLGLYLPGSGTPSRAISQPNASQMANVTGAQDGLNPFTGRYDEILLPVFPNEIANNKGFVGNLEDLGLVHINLQGAWTPQSGIERVAWGNTLVPFTIAPVL